IAFALLSLAGDRPAQVLAALMATTAFLSLWISNTAAAMIIAPIAAGIAVTSGAGPRFGTALMLGVAYAATIGGIGTLIGTPPNAIFAACVAEAHGIEIGFAEWAAVGMPVAALLLLTAWAVLAFVTPRVGTARLHTSLDGATGPMTAAEIRVAVLAAATALAWMLRPTLESVAPGLGISDAGIALTAVVALALVPSGQGGALLDWEHASRLRWDVLILFGGGLALAGLLETSGLAGWIGARAVVLEDLPLPALILAMAVLVVGLGELASNTAIASIFLPVAGAVAASLGAEPAEVLFPVALAASLGFMLPVATPPNAIVFGPPWVGRAAMLRAGAMLDATGIVLAVAAGNWLTRWVE
ncbi:DASS family sodium-coupled anion symporter, partial [Cereibacter sphaeroides]|uniref:SLC13 family permease n=1 Tax=Cereibacter sphaeroides TaxID=1063 RepID=UPI001F4458F3